MAFALQVINRIWVDTIKNYNMATHPKHQERWDNTMFNHVDHYLSAYRELSKHTALAHGRRIPMLSTGISVTWPILQLDSTNHSWDVSNAPSTEPAQSYVRREIWRRFSRGCGFEAFVCTCVLCCIQFSMEPLPLSLGLTDGPGPVLLTSNAASWVASNPLSTVGGGWGSLGGLEKLVASQIWSSCW